MRKGSVDYRIPGKRNEESHACKIEIEGGASYVSIPSLIIGLQTFQKTFLVQNY